jgi:hypothetical protein
MKPIIAIAGENRRVLVFMLRCGIFSALFGIFAMGQSLPAQVIDFITASDSARESSPNWTAPQNAPSAGSQIEFGNLYRGPFEGWSIDYRVRSVHSSYTSYEFGMPEYEPVSWAPLSKLEFPLNSTWHGLQILRQTPNTNMRFEWLTPIGNGINGEMHDYDWTIPGADYTDLGIMKQRWNDGQMLDFNFEYKLFDNLLLPVEFWLSCGFRWQRFDITNYALVQVKDGDVWPANPYVCADDVITFNQQYSTEYIGGEFRKTLAWIPTLPLQLRLMGDYGAAQGYNCDHHLIREGDRYTMESTTGDSLHYALSAELSITKTITLGAQYDQLFIRTQGEHHFYNEPYGVDERWNNGVRVQSDQSWFTIYLRLSV